MAGNFLMGEHLKKGTIVLTFLLNRGIKKLGGKVVKKMVLNHEVAQNHFANNQPNCLLES